MGDKFDGALAGGGRSHDAQIELSDAVQNLSLDESLVVLNDAGELVLLKAVQNPYHGGLMVMVESGEATKSALTEAIKLSQMTSMLNDRDRCSKYNAAISKVLKARPASRVLDIGTGTGLLGMMAARAGATFVDAIEMFEPLAALAREIISVNSFESRMTVHTGKSTDLSICSDSAHIERDGTLAAKSDVLVTEIFDSALLGEGCLPVISHAHKVLLNEGAAVIPSRAVVYGVVVCSEFLAKFRDLGVNFPLHRAKSAHECQGGGRGIPLHLDALRADYEPVSSTFEIFDFDFSSPALAELDERTRSLNIPRTGSGEAHAVITWWVLDLFGAGEIQYSSEDGVENWQDHWLPVCYPLPSSKTNAALSEEIQLTAGHDQMSLWFARGADARSPPICSCGFHALPGGPYRIFELGDPARLASLQTRITAAIKEVESATRINERIRCIDLSESSVCGLFAAQVMSSKVVDVLSVEEDNELSVLLYGQVARRLGQFSKKPTAIAVEHSSLSDVIANETKVKHQEQGWQGINVVFSEPYTRAMAAHPLATLANLIVQRNALRDITAARFAIVPRFGRIRGKAISFEHSTMQKAFGRVIESEGLDHSPFAALYEHCPGRQLVSLPLFQYVTEDISNPTTILEVDLCQPFTFTEPSPVRISLMIPKRPDAIVLWVEYDGEAPVRVGRSEVAWLSQKEGAAIAHARGVDAFVNFSIEKGTFELEFKPAVP